MATTTQSDTMSTRTTNVRMNNSDGHQVQHILGQFDAKINKMMDYPAKDIINSLTMLAERREFAPQIVQFLETKIHRVLPQYKLPIFYLTDSILKNVRDPYPKLFTKSIVPLYCNCVRQVSEKDLKRFMHVLNTWESTRIFPPDALAQMREAATQAQQDAGSSRRSAAPRDLPVTQAPSREQSKDQELRSLLTQLQNDMGIHPMEHMSLEEVRTNNPAYYSQLLAFHSGQPVEQVVEPPRQAPEPIAETGGILGTPPGPSQAIKRRPAPRRSSPPKDPRAARKAASEPKDRSDAPVRHERPSDKKQESSKSGNVSHLMELLKKKKQTPDSTPPSEPEVVTNDPPRAPDPHAVMSILQKLKGLNQSNASNMTSAASSSPPTNVDDSESTKMWFSDKIVAHKDRVESNVHKLYAALPLVCRESGLRFSDQKKLDAHLDFLFQYNRAKKERGRGGISRSWYPDESQWISDVVSESVPRETTSSSAFALKEIEEESKESWENARVPVDESVTRCRICGENFAKSWDEEEEDWMYTNAVVGTIHDPKTGNPMEQTIFHKYCHDAVISNSKRLTPDLLIPLSPRKSDEKANKRSFEADVDSDEDVKRARTN